MYSRTIRCYDCQAEVMDLRSHRSVCPNSRKVRSVVDPLTRESKVAVTCTFVRPDRFAHCVDYYLLVDASGSMSGTRIENARVAVTRAVSKMKEDDRVAMITFDTTPYFKLKPRPVGQILRQNELPDLLARIKTLGQTAIWDAIDMAVTQIRDKTKKTVVHVITDGEDNSSHITYDMLLNRLKEFPNVTLNIMHVGDRFVEQYKQICEHRGNYQLILETDIVSATISVLFK